MRLVIRSAYARGQAAGRIHARPADLAFCTALSVVAHLVGATKYGRLLDGRFSPSTLTLTFRTSYVQRLMLM